MTWLVVFELWLMRGVSLLAFQLKCNRNEVSVRWECGGCVFDVWLVEVKIVVVACVYLLVFREVKI